MLRSEGPQTAMEAPTMPRMPATAPSSSHHMHRMMDTAESANQSSSSVRCWCHLRAAPLSVVWRRDDVELL